jgi:putative hydrolase of the HAD superfamily
MIIMRIKAVFFDFGDTLAHASPDFDTETCIYRFHRSLLKNGISISYEDCRKTYVEVADKFFSRNYIKEITFGFVLSETLKRLGYSLEPIDKIIVEAAEAYMEPWIQARTIDRHAPSILRGLRKKYKLGIVSNITYSPAVLKTLERFDLVNLFDVVITSVDVGWRKPSPRIFRRALQAMKVSASESVFVGDELDHDVEGAQKVGMRTILLNRRSAEETLRNVKPNVAICEWKELPHALESLEAKA